MNIHKKDKKSIDLFFSFLKNFVRKKQNISAIHPPVTKRHILRHAPQFCSEIPYNAEEYCITFFFYRQITNFRQRQYSFTSVFCMIFFYKPIKDKRDIRLRIFNISRQKNSKNLLHNSIN